MTSSLFKGIRLLLAFVVFALFQPLTISAVYEVPSVKTPQAAEQRDRSAVLLYGEFEDAQSGRQDLLALYSLLRAYCSKVSLVSVSDYRPDLLNGAQYVFFAGMRREQLRPDIGSDLKTFPGVIGWVGGGVERYKNYGLTTGFEVEGYVHNIANLRYPLNNNNGRGEEPVLIGQRTFTPELAVKDVSIAKTYGTISDGANAYPYAVNSGNVWCISTFQANGPDVAVFRDVLDRMFDDVAMTLSPNVYIKLNQVSPFSDMDKLQAAANWLNTQGVPFMMELRPVFVNIEYAQMQAYFKLIRKLQKLGGTSIIGNLQGWTRPDEWNTYVEKSLPIEGAGELSASKLMNASLQAYVKYGVYPVALSGPLDLLFDPELAGVLHYFTNYVQNGAWLGYSRDLGPEAAWKGTYISEAAFGKGNLDVLGRQAAAFPELTRSGRAVVFDFDATNEVDQLEAVVLHLKEMGVSFANLGKQDSEVTFGDTRIVVAAGNLTINGKSPIYREDQAADVAGDVSSGEQLSGVNKRIKQTMFFVLIIVSIFVGLFILAFIAGKRMDKKKHLR